MSQLLKSIDPNQFVCLVGGTLIDGYSDDQVKIGKMEADWKYKAGTTGEVARLKNNNEMGYIEFSLLQTSDSNDFLSARRLLDKSTGKGTAAVRANDTLGTTDVKSTGCFIEQLPDIERGGEVKTVTWRIIMPFMKATIGGNVANIDS